MPVDDPQNYSRRLETALDKIYGVEENEEDEEEEIPGLQKEADLDLIDDWFEDNRHDLSDGTLISYLTCLRRFSEATDKPIVDHHKRDYQKVLNKMADANDWSKGTIRNYQKSLKVILGYAGEREKRDHLKLTTISDETQEITSDDILSSEQIRVLLEECARNDRDRAMIYLLYETGARISAILSLRVRDVKFEEGPGGSTLIQFNEEAKALKGAKNHEVIVKPSQVFLENYLFREHPAPEKKDAPFFIVAESNYGEDKDNSLSPPLIRRRLKRLVKDCDEIPKEKVNPHNFRHSRVTHMREEGYSDRQIANRMNWDRETEMLKRYDHTTRQKQHIEDAEMMGLEVEEETRSPKLSSCPRCSNPIDDVLGWEVCPRCQAQLKMHREPEWFEEYMSIMGDEEDDPIHLYFLRNPHELYDEFAQVNEETRMRVSKRVVNKCAEEGLDRPSFLNDYSAPIPDPAYESFTEEELSAMQEEYEASGD